MAVKIILKHSSVEDKRPSVSQLENGEIALNYNEAGAFLTCKDTNGDIQQVGGIKINETAPDSPPIQCLWFKPSTLTLFIYDGTNWLPIAGGGGGGGTPGGGDIIQIIGNDGIDASEIAGIVTLDVELDGTNCGLTFNSSKLSAVPASDTKLGSIKTGDHLTTTADGTTSVDVASQVQRGVVQIGDNIDVSAAGTISVDVASKSQLGVVQVGAGIDVDANGTISVDIGDSLVYRGSVDLNNPPAGQINPDPAEKADAYVASSNADPIDAGWTGIGGDAAVAGDLVVYNGTQWELVGTGGSVDAFDDRYVKLVGDVTAQTITGTGGLNVEGLVSVGGDLNIDALRDAEILGTDAAGNVVAKPAGASAGDGALTIETAGEGASSTGTFTANQAGDSTLTLPTIRYQDLSGQPSIPTVGDGQITIRQPGTTDQTFTVNQSGPTVIDLLNDDTVVTPGDGSLTIQNFGDNTTDSTGTFTANQSTGSTIVLPQIKYANIDGTPTIPTVGNGLITIKQPGIADQTFRTNDSGDTEINLLNGNAAATPGDGALTIETAGEGASATGTFTADQAGDSTLVLPTIRYQDLSGAPTIPTVGDGLITIRQPGTTDQTFTVNQAGPTVIDLKNDDTVVTPGDGALTIQTAGEGASSTGVFTANRSTGGTLTLPTIRYQDLSGTPSIPSVGNGALTVRNFGDTTNSTGTFTANQSGAGTVTLPQIKYANISGTPTIPSDHVGLYLSKTGPDTGVGPITSNNGFIVGSGFGKTTWDASGSVISWKGDAAGQIYRFSADDTTKANAGLSSDFSHIVQITSNLTSNALSCSRFNTNTGANLNYSKVAIFANRADNVNLTGGNSNNNNTPGCIATLFKFTDKTKANNFNFYNIQSCLSTTPARTSAIAELNLYYAPASCIGYNDGTPDISLANAKIRGFHCGLDGGTAGSTQVWAFYGSGDAPSYFGGLVRASKGIDFSTDKDAIAANANETLEHYEKGSYTPVLNSSGGATYSSVTGSYIIIGNRCEVLIDLTYSGATGTSQISVSVPFQSKAVSGNLAGLSGNCYIFNSSTALTMPIAATIGNNQTATLLVKGGVRTQNYTQSTVKYSDATNGQLRIQLSYTI